MFDTSVDVTDYKENGDLSSHIANFFDADFRTIAQNLEMIKTTVDPSSPNPISYERGVGLSMVSNELILENHLIDYCLKEYMQLTTGINMNEETLLFRLAHLKLLQSV